MAYCPDLSAFKIVDDQALFVKNERPVKVVKNWDLRKSRERRWFGSVADPLRGKCEV